MALILLNSLSISKKIVIWYENHLESNLPWILCAGKVILAKNHQDVFVNNAPKS